jgi:hypothetical protein
MKKLVFLQTVLGKKPAIFPIDLNEKTFAYQWVLSIFIFLKMRKKQRDFTSLF